jgi:periplasmic protein CpxP/Spy
MKVRTLILTIAAAALIAAPAVLIAQQGPGGPGDGSCDGSGPNGGGMRGPHGGGGFGGPGQHGFLRMLPRLADKLDLSEDQQSQIQAIVDAGRIEIEPLREQAQTERAAFKDSHEIGAYDEGAFSAHFESQAQLHVEMQLIGARMMSEAWVVLTIEQQEELLELMELIRDGRGGPRNGGGKRHGRG